MSAYHWNTKKVLKEWALMLGFEGLQFVTKLEEGIPAVVREGVVVCEKGWKWIDYVASIAHEDKHMRFDGECDATRDLTPDGFDRIEERAELYAAVVILPYVDTLGCDTEEDVQRRINVAFIGLPEHLAELRFRFWKRTRDFDTPLETGEPRWEPFDWEAHEIRCKYGDYL